MDFKIFKDNKEVECEIVFTFRDQNNGINYVVYTDGTLDENNELEIYASRYELQDGEYNLLEIETEYEWDLVDNMIEAKCREVGENDAKI